MNVLRQQIRLRLRQLAQQELFARFGGEPRRTLRAMSRSLAARRWREARAEERRAAGEAPIKYAGPRGRVNR